MTLGKACVNKKHNSNTTSQLGIVNFFLVNDKAILICIAAVKTFYFGVIIDVLHVSGFYVWNSACMAFLGTRSFRFYFPKIYT